MSQAKPQRPPKGRGVGLFWLSAAGHLLVGLALFGTLSGGGIRGVANPYGEGETLNVSLGGHEGGLAGPMSEAIEDAEVTEVGALAKRLRNVAPDGMVVEQQGERPRSTLSELFGALGAGGGRGRSGDGSDATGQDGPTDQDKVATTSVKGDQGSAASAGDLWGQIEPCWHSLSPPNDAPSVTLEVVLDGNGTLARPPRILRSVQGAPAEAQLLAEARALTAIQRCLPYSSPSFPGKVQRVEFGQTRPGGKTRRR